MTKQEHNKRSVNIARTEWFKEHIKHAAPDPNLVTWQKTGSSNYYMRYRIDGQYLIVTGDAGDAIYAWGQVLTWDWLATLELDYFVSKCCASEVGRPYVQWSHRVTAAWLDAWKKENPKLADKLEESYSLGNKEEFHRFLETNHKYFDFEDADVGEVLNIRAIGHWVGIQMMFGGKRLEYYQ